MLKLKYNRSKAMKDKWNNKDYRKKQIKAHTGKTYDKSSNWQGGKQKHTDGYMWRYSPNHPFKTQRNCVFEHRLIMEEYLRKFKPNHKFLIEINGKKYLRKGVQVHHINEIKNDNRLINLKIFDNVEEHSRFHSRRLDIPSKEVIKLHKTKSIIELSKIFNCSISTIYKRLRTNI